MNVTRLAALLGFVGVALGAFGAHGLRTRVGPEMIEVWKTAVLYQLVHALALLALGLAPGRAGWRRAVAGLWTAGVVLFSGSLYGLVLVGARWLGPITPLGGVAFMAGWAVLFFFCGTAAGDGAKRSAGPPTTP